MPFGTALTYCVSWAMTHGTQSLAAQAVQHACKAVQELLQKRFAEKILAPMLRCKLSEKACTSLRHEQSDDDDAQADGYSLTHLSGICRIQSMMLLHAFLHCSSQQCNQYEQAMISVLRAW